MNGPLKKVPLLRNYPFIPDLISPIEFLTSPKKILLRGKQLNSDIFSFRMGTQPWIFISGKEGVQFYGKLKDDSVDPTYFRSRLPALDLPGIKTPNLEHTTTRAVATAIKEHLETIGQEAFINLFIKETTSFFDENAEQEGTIANLAEFLNKLYMRIIGVALLGNEIYASLPKDFEEALMVVINNSTLITVMFPFLPSVAFKNKANFVAAKQTITNYLLELIEKRKKNKAPSHFPVLIDRIIELQKDHPELRLTDLDLVFHFHAAFWVAQVYIVAHSFWLLIEILTQPNILPSLLKEQAQFEELNLQSINNMKVLEGSVRELMRLYSMLALPRKVIKELEFKGYRIPKNSILVMSPFLEHQDATIYPDPNKFNPARWDATPDSNTYTSFVAGGFGVFRCIAQPFSIQLLMTCTAYILRHYKLELIQKAPTVKPQLIFLPPTTPVALRYKKLV